MWLSRCELKNFKSYCHQIFEFPKPEAGKNLVLIGGINGYGKTTLLEAIYVGLYGEEAIKHKALDSAGLKTKSYGHFLETAFHRLAPADGQDRMEVSIEFARDAGSILRVTRKWFFNSKGKYDNQSIVVETKFQNGDWQIRDKELLPELLELFATPPWLASFFFFDGEKIAGLADEDRTGWIQSGLENLLGVVLVRELRAQLTTYITNKLREVGGVDEQRIEELKCNLESEQEAYESLCEGLRSQFQQLSETKELRDRLSNQLHGLAQGSDARTVAEVAEKKEVAAQKADAAWKKLRGFYALQLPLNLVRKELYDSLEKTLAGEHSLTEWEQSKARMQPNWEKFQNTFFSSPWIGGLCHLPGARDSLEKTLSDAWESLHYPRPIECTDAIWHTALQANERRKLYDMRSKNQISAASLRKTLEDLKQAKSEEWRLQQELIRLEGADGESRSQQIDDLNKQLIAAQNKIDILGPQCGSMENEQRALQANVSNLSATYERERKKLVEGHPERQAAQEAEKVVSLIDSLLPLLFDLKLKALSEAVTRIFRKLHHKDQVAEIVISRTGQATLFSYEGVEINLPKSSGESQLFVLALVGALAEVTGYSVPMIIDTPLARLSETHCKNLLAYWASNPERQVILLSQDKEIGGKEHLELSDSVSKTYLLKHKQIREGVGLSEAIPNQYFEVSK